MILLEKIEINEEYVKYHYFEREDKEKGILIYFLKTGICRTEKLCEGDSECLDMYRRNAFIRIMKYVRENNYPEKDMVAWG